MQENEMSNPIIPIFITFVPVLQTKQYTSDKSLLIFQFSYHYIFSVYTFIHNNSELSESKYRIAFSFFARYLLDMIPILVHTVLKLLYSSF